MSFNSDHSDFEDEESKWDYFRKLKQLDHDQVNEHDVTLRKYIDDTQSSILSDEMNAMERALKLTSLRDSISDNIMDKIDDPKDRMLVGLLYNVCNDIDPTRMHFIKFSILLYEHGILNNLDFLMDSHHIKSLKPDDLDEWSDSWSDDDDENEKKDDNIIENIENIANRERMSFSSLVPHLNEIKTDSDSQILPLTTPNKSITMNDLSSRYHREFEEISCIGYGQFGTVYKVRHLLDSSQYAIKKVLYKHNGANHESIKCEITREVSNMAQLNHENIIRYYTSWIEPMITTNITDRSMDIDTGSDNDNGIGIGDNERSLMNYWSKKVRYSCLFIQTEYCGSYSLKDFIENVDRIADRDENMHLFAQILLGLAHCHSKQMIHRDLKPENIFLVNNSKEIQHVDNAWNIQQLTAKIGDFGLSRSLMDDYVVGSGHTMGTDTHDTVDLTANTGTVTYAAPEQLSTNVYSVSADIYSLGVILWEMIQAPFDTMMERRIAMSAFRKLHSIDHERIDCVKFGKEIEIILKMTQMNPGQRPSAYSLIFDQFIQIYWMKNVLNGAIPPIIHHHNGSSGAINGMSAMKSLEYEYNEEISVVETHINGNDKNSNDSPTFLISSPSTPPKILILDNENENSSKAHRNVVKVMSPLSISMNHR